MSETKCPGCGALLLVRDTTYPMLSCPRCLAPVPNPNLAQPPPLAPARWRRPVEERAKRDRNWTSAALGALAVFGALGTMVAGADSGLWILVPPVVVWGAVVTVSGKRGGTGTLARIVLGVFAVAGVFTLLGLALLVFLLVTCMNMGFGK